MNTEFSMPKVAMIPKSELDDNSYLGLKFINGEYGAPGTEIIRNVMALAPTDGTEYYFKNETDHRYMEYGTMEGIQQRGFSPLRTSCGVITFSVVTIRGNKDVVVTLMRHSDIKAGLYVPCVICRQSVTDFFYNIISRELEHEYVGVSVSDRTCPPNIQYAELLACDDIDYMLNVYVYYDDTIDSVLSCIDKGKFDNTLDELYLKHVEHVGDPKLKLARMHKGWCRTLKDLLTVNNFFVDFDQAFNIIDVDFNVNEHIITKKDINGVDVPRMDSQMTAFLSSEFKLNITNSYVLEYGYDLNLATWKNNNYMLIKDKSNKLYFIVYLVNNEILESEFWDMKRKEAEEGNLAFKIYAKYRDQEQS